MKLALVRQRYTPFGGAERFMDRALDALRASGTEVTVIARDWPEGATPGTLLRCDPYHLGRTWRDAGFAHAVRRLIAQDGFDLVQSHERIPGCHLYRAGDGVHATWLGLRDRIISAPERVVTRLQPWHRYTLQAEAAMFRHPQLRTVICNSRMVMDDIAARFGVAPEKLRLIRNGVDLDYFHPEPCGRHRDRVREELRISDSAPVLLFVGSGFRRKGLPQLLSAFARLGNAKAHLIVVGRDRQEQAMLRHARWLGISGQVHFLGRQQDVRPFYGAADAFALPTLYDPFPNAALEAMACGLPVVTSTTSGIAELITHGRNGFVGDAFDVGGIALNLDAALRAGSEVGAAARQAAEALPIEATAAQMIALYRELLEMRPV